MFRQLINLFYPDLCKGCKAPLATGQEIICVACRMQLPYVVYDSLTNNTVTKSFQGRMEISCGVALFYYQKNTIVQELLHELKYKNAIEIATAFGSELASLLQKYVDEVKPEAIVPVPMHSSKLKTRGYNQAELIANQLGKELNLPVLTTVLQKELLTGSQTKKDRFDRWRNSEESYVCKSYEGPSNVLLVDDVITTGATLEACAAALRQQKPELKIGIASLAFTYR